MADRTDEQNLTTEIDMLIAFHGDQRRGRNWRGGRMAVPGGYVMLYDPKHARAGTNGYVEEHVLIAERALGRPLPVDVVVHHVDEQKQNNTPSNLVICPNRAYHNFLHRRMRALDACGHADWLICCRCHRYDAPANLSYNAKASQAWHRACAVAYQRNRTVKCL